MQAALAEAGGSIDDLIETFARTLVADPQVPRVVFGQSAGVSPTVERRRRENRRWAAGFVEAVWRQHGVVRGDSDIRPIALATVGALFELITDWLFDGSEDVDELIGELVAYHRIVRAGLESIVDGVISDR
jgi:hypothetical protein